MQAKISQKLKIYSGFVVEHALGVIMFFWSFATLMALFSLLSGLAYTDNFLIGGENIRSEGISGQNRLLDIGFNDLEPIIPTTIITPVEEEYQLAQAFVTQAPNVETAIRRSAQNIEREPIGKSSNDSLLQEYEEDVLSEPIVVPVPFKSPGLPEDVGVKVQGWIYPGPPACDALDDIGLDTFHVLKPEYFALRSTGNLEFLSVAVADCNGWSEDNSLAIKESSVEQYVTISGHTAGLQSLMDSSAKQADFISSVVEFLDNNGFTGVELDFEGFGGWSEQLYLSYLVFIEDLGSTLQADGYRLMIDLPPISNEIEQSYYELSYSDFEDLPVDALTVMAYDYQYDYGGGNPIAPHAWVENIIDRIQTQITDNSRIVIGIPAYGYQAACGSYDVSILTYDQAASSPGFASAVRDADSAEMMWENNGICYSYQDDQSVDLKRAVVESKGVESISIWHLGGGNKFGS